MYRLIIISFFIANSLFAQEGTWNVFTQMEREVAGAASYTAEPNVFFLGGYAGSVQSNTDWNSLFKHNLNVWKRKGDIDTIRYGLSLSTFADTVYYWGGVDADSSSMHSKNLISFYGNDTSSTYATNRNFNRLFSNGHIIDNKLFIIGGNTYFNGSIKKVPYIVAYDLKNKSFVYESVSKVFNGENPEQQMTVQHGIYIYIFGGITNTVSNKIYRFNTQTYAIEEEIVILKTPRAGGKAVYDQSTGKIYLIGGFNENTNVLRSVEVYRLNNNEIEFLKDGPELMVGRRSFSCSLQNDQILIFGGFNSSDQVEKTSEQLTLGAITSIKDDNQISKYQLQQNYPNPFNPSTTIKFSVPERTNVKLIIYSISGEIVKEVVNDEHQIGEYSFDVDMTNYSSGVYFYTLITNKTTITKKMLYLK